MATQEQYASPTNLPLPKDHFPVQGESKGVPKYNLTRTRLGPRTIYVVPMRRRNPILQNLLVYCIVYGGSGVCAGLSVLGLLWLVGVLR